MVGAGVGSSESSDDAFPCDGSCLVGLMPREVLYLYARATSFGAKFLCPGVVAKCGTCSDVCEGRINYGFERDL
jgi:hypothetical protein